VHVPWRVWATTSAGVDGDSNVLYGPEFSRILKGRPDSAFIADGSPVRVLHGARVS
jgi:hypothetical protein